MRRWIPAIAAFALPVTPGSPAREVTTVDQAKTSYLYVADLVGTWRASIGRDIVLLKPLMRVPMTAQLRLPSGGDTTSSIALRHPRTQTLYRLVCSSKTPCTDTFAVTRLRGTVRHDLADKADAQHLYADLGEREEIRERIRLVGARGDARELGIVVLTRSGASVDLRELLAKVDQPRERLVARFCSLTDTTTDSSECIESRRRMPNDCDLAAPSCEVPAVSPAAYRVDVYTRERSMLGSLAEASGFAAIVTAAELARAVATRDSFAGTLKALAPALYAEELRGLTAAAALRVAGVAR